MAAEAQQQGRVALGDEVERIAQMQTGNRAARTFQFAGAAAGKDEGRPMQLFLDATGDDADHALVPAGVEQRQAGAGTGVDVGEDDRRGVLHVGLDTAPLAVDGVEFLGDVEGARNVVAAQAFDAQRHVGEAAGGVEARPEREAEVEGRCAFRYCAR